MLDEKTYSLLNYNEAKKVMEEWTDLEQQADKINGLLPAEYKDAFFELVLYPVKAFGNLHQLYLSVAKNKLYAAGSLGEANDYAAAAKKLYQKDSLFTIDYHHVADGKWNHVMDQTHIGYTYWQQPPVNKMPETTNLPREKWVDSALTFPSSNRNAKNLLPKRQALPFFYEENGIVSIEADHWARAIESKNIRWKVIPDIGRDGSGITTFPVTASSELSSLSPHVEYEFYTYDSGKANLYLYFSPTLNFHNDSTGLRYAVSIDGEKPQIFSLNKEDNNLRTWESWVANNVIIKKIGTSDCKIGQAHDKVLDDFTCRRPAKTGVRFWRDESVLSRSARNKMEVTAVVKTIDKPL